MDISNDINVISRLGKALQILKLLEIALTVGIMAFTVFKIINLFREQN